MIKIAIMVPHGSGRKLTLRRLLNSIPLHENIRTFIFNDTEKVLKEPEESKYVTVVNRDCREHPSRIGCGYARRELLKHLKTLGYDAVISVDDDSWFEKTAINRIIEAYNEKPQYNLYTTRVVQSREIRASGRNMIIDDKKTLKSEEIRDRKEEYYEADWGIGTSMVFARKALTGYDIPKVYIINDEAGYLEAIKCGLGKILVVNKAFIHHKQDKVVPNHRSAEEIKRCAKQIWKEYDVDVVSHSKGLRRWAGLEEASVDEVQKFLNS